MILDKLTDLIQGKVEKMLIKAYLSDQDAESDKSAVSQYKALINPESYVRNYKICHGSDEQAPGTSSKALKFYRIAPDELNFTFLFDDSGIIDGDIRDVLKLKRGEGVMDDIDNFRNTLIKFDGSAHRPYTVRLLWGKLDFIGKADSINIVYRLFSPGGVPIRADATVHFTATKSDQLREAKEKKSSPDLTHILRVKAGDTLPLMCKKVYGDPKYYLQVAGANGLGNFRKLEPGMEIVFPPIDKTNNA